MSFRLPSQTPENIWKDSQRVNQSDLRVEQAHNDQNLAAVVNNHFGSGVLPSSLEQNVLFDSDALTPDQVALLAANIFDGTGVQAHAQPSDISLGNQLEITLTDSEAKGRKSVKVAIIGLDFENNIQQDRLYFYKNEVQVTSQHYKKILGIFFNDFKGNSNCSRVLGGRITVKEARSFQISRDAVMVAQDVEPDLFWRDFKKPNPITTLQQVIQTGIGPEYSVDGLDINTTSRPDKELLPNNVVAQVGQKFQATGDNIQKITLCLAVNELTGVPQSQLFNWTGDLVISIYPLQTSVGCISDIVPGLPIDFDPDIVPIGQVSFTQATLRETGYLLNDVMQPVDFVFSNTGMGKSGGIEEGKYYALTVKRAGAANLNTIRIAVGNDKLDNSVETLFSGSTWVDVPEEDLWFQVWTDAIKIADGQGYDMGNGMFLPKTIIDESTGATIDNEVGNYSFQDTGENILNVAVIKAIVEESFKKADELTGNKTFSRQQFVPQLSLVSESGLVQLRLVSDPLIVGGVKDGNPKDRPAITKVQRTIGLAKGNNFCIVNPDADLLSNNLIGSKFIPNTNNAGVAYKVIKTSYCTDGYGDVNGDGIIDAQDIAALTALIGESIYLTATQQRIVSGEVDVLQLLRADLDGDGYITANDGYLLTNYVNKITNSFPVGSSFSHMCLELEHLTGRYDSIYDCGDGYIRLDGYDGYQGNVVPISSLDPNTLQYDGYLSDIYIENTDSVFTTTPFSPYSFQLVYQPFWKDFLLHLSSNARLVPSSFVYSASIDHPPCSNVVETICEDRNEDPPEVDPGRVDFLIPGNLVIGEGEVLRPDGSAYKVDFEHYQIELRIPDVALNEVKINVFESFVADRGDGFTNAKYPAARYADCSTVQPQDLSLNKVQMTAAITAINPAVDGYDQYGFVAIIDNLIAVNLDSGILTLSIKDMQEDNVFASMITKLTINVYLKKSGFNNLPLVVSSDELIGLIVS